MCNLRDKLCFILLDWVSYTWLWWWLPLRLSKHQLMSPQTVHTYPSLRKQRTFREVATWALAKRRLSNERRNSILIYPGLVSASDWLKENSLAAQPIRSTTKIWVVHVIRMEFLSSFLIRRFSQATLTPDDPTLPTYKIKCEHTFKCVTVIKWGWKACMTTSPLCKPCLIYPGISTNFASCIYILNLVQTHTVTH